MTNRYLSNLFCTRWTLNRAFPASALDAIEQAVADSEAQHDGELKFAIESAIDTLALLRSATPHDRAVSAFAQLGTWDTAANNGVLIYLLLSEQVIEIVADRGYDGKVSEAEWQRVCTGMQQAFQRGEFEAGALAGIAEITALIGRHYPFDPGKAVNELPDRPTIL